MSSVWGAGGRPHVRSCGGQDPVLGRSRQLLPCVPGPGPPPSSPCASACPSNPRGTSRSPTLPSCSPSWWETPEPPQEGKNALLELLQQSGPPGTSLPRLSEHAGPWQPHKGPLCARGPAPPWLSARRERREGRQAGDLQPVGRGVHRGQEALRSGVEPGPGAGPGGAGRGAAGAGTRVPGPGWEAWGGRGRGGAGLQ